MPNSIIRNINAEGTLYDISAQYLMTSEGVDKTWEDITALISAGIQLVVDDADPETGLPVTTPSAETMGKIYLVPAGTSPISGMYVEFITVENSGAYNWEKIGTTETDLSGYAKKGNITLTGTAAEVASSATSSTDSGASANTETAGAISETIQIIDTKGAPEATGSAGAAVDADTGSAGGETVDTTGAEAHSHDVAIAAHNHTISPSTDSSSVITAVGDAASAGAHTHSVTTEAHSHAVNATTNSIASYDNGTLVLNTTAYLSAVTLNTADPAGTAASGGAHTHSVSSTPATLTYMTGATLDTAAPNGSAASGGAHTHSVGSTPATLTYMTGATLDQVAGYTVTSVAAGAHTHSVTTSNHTHSYKKADAHTHSITAVTSTWTYELSVSAHSHGYTKPTAHTHSVEKHSHTVSVSGNNYNA